MKDHKKKYTWGTKREIMFLDSIGKHQVTLKRIPSKKKLLENYIASLRMRQRWGNINKDRVMSHAKDLLVSVKE